MAIISQLHSDIYSINNKNYTNSAYITYDIYNISDISQPHENQNNVLNHSQYINLLNVHRNTEKNMLKTKKKWEHHDWRKPYLPGLLTSYPWRLSSYKVSKIQ